MSNTETPNSQATVTAHGAYISYPSPGIVRMFADIEGEDEGQKAPIYKSASATPSNPSYRAACIFLHDVAGEGQNFTPFASISADYKLPHLQWVFPTAPWNARIRQPAWFTPTRFSQFSSRLPNANAPEDEEEILHSVRTIVNLIDDLVKQGIPAKRIVVGGRGQGHSIALLTSIVSEYSGQLGGVIGQFGYLPLWDRISALREKQQLPKQFVPVPLSLSCAMADPYLPRTEFSAQVHKLKELGYTDATIKISMYPNMSCLDAAMSPLPLKEALEFLGQVVPQIEGSERVKEGSKNVRDKQTADIRSGGSTGGDAQQNEQAEERARSQKGNLQSKQMEDKRQTGSRSVRRIFGRVFGSRNQDGSSS